MTQTAIPVEFESYLQNKINDGGVPDMNQMIFAYIPGLDTETAIDRSLGLPDAGYWVHQQDIDQSGKLGDNALVYSVVIPSAVAAFTFNAIYLHDKNVSDSCGMVVYKDDETKEDGMAATKSLVQQYSGAAQMSGITVDAGTWQIDYQARLLGIEEDHRLTCLDSYGHSAFIDGFNVTQEADPTKYKITPGLVYIGGLRATLDAENIQTIINKPNGIYLDVHREGTALSTWDNVLTITLSETEITDYIDAQGKQHYVAKLAAINADGSISDQRIEQTGELERADNAATDDDIDAESTGEKHIKLPQFWGGIAKKVDKIFEDNRLRAVSGYQVLPGGMIFQWGRVSCNPDNGSAGTTAAFPVTFPNACFRVVCSDVGVGVHRASAQASGLSQVLAWGKTAENNFANTSIDYIAIGY